MRQSKPKPIEDTAPMNSEPPHAPAPDPEPEPESAADKPPQVQAPCGPFRKA